MARSRFDLLALSASCLAVLMLGVYVAIMREQDDQPLWWFSVAMAAGAASAAYGVYRPAPFRRAVLFVAAAVLGACGMLGLLTIGAPILFAGVLCLLAALLERPVPADR